MLVDDDSGEAGDGARNDPFSDLLFALVTAAIPIIALLLPMAQMEPSPAAARNSSFAKTLARADLTIDGRRAQPFVAAADGLRISEAGGRTIALDAIQDDPGLQRLLMRHRDEGLPLLLIVDEDGLESAFLFESVAAAYGPAELHQLRLDGSCSIARAKALADACVARRLPRPGAPS